MPPLTFFEGQYTKNGGYACLKTSARELKENVHTIRYSPDRAFIALGMGNGCIKIFDSATMHQQQRQKMNFLYDGLPTTSVRWAPLGENDAVYKLGNCNSNGGVFTWIWDPEPHNYLEQQLLIREDKNDTTCFEFSLDGLRMFTAGADRTIRAYDRQTGTLQESYVWSTDEHGNTFYAHPSRIFSIKLLSPTLLISAGWESPIHLWDLRTGRAERRISGVHAGSDCLEVIPDTSNFVCCSQRKTNAIQIFDFATCAEIEHFYFDEILEGLGSPTPVCCRYSVEDNVLWIACSKPHMIVGIDMKMGKLLTAIPVETLITCIDCAPKMPVIFGGFAGAIFLVQKE